MFSEGLWMFRFYCVGEEENEAIRQLGRGEDNIGEDKMNHWTYLNKFVCYFLLFGFIYFFFLRLFWLG